MSVEPFSDDDERAFTAIAGAGARAAAAALARFLDAGGFSVDDVRVMTRSELVQSFGADVAAVSFVLSGGLDGALMHVLHHDEASALLERLPGGRTGSGHGFDAREQGALSEVGNIAASAFLNEVARHVGKACLPSVPRFSVGDVAEALRAADAPDETARVVAVRLHVDGRPPVALTLVVLPRSS